MRKRIIYVLFFLIFLPFALGWGAHVMVKKNAENQVFTDIEQIHKNKVGLVLGTSKYSVRGGINLYFQYRIDATVELFKKGKIDFILVSGDNSTNSYNEPKHFQEELIKRGIPADKIFLDYAGFRTLDSILRAKKVFGLTSFTVISQKFHNERAIYIANHQDMEVIGYNAKDVPQNYSIKTVVREYLARIKAVLDQLMDKQPKFLGETIEIK